MTAIEQPLKAEPPSLSHPQVSHAKGALLEAVFELLNEEGHPWCVLHGYEEYPHSVRSDVDLLVTRAMLRGRFVRLLRENQKRLGARVVQWFSDRAAFVVLAAPGADDSAAPVMLQLHLSSDYEVENRLVFTGEEMLEARRAAPAGRDGFAVPSAAMEFGAVLANRLVKGNLDETRARKLTALWTADPIGCSRQAARLLDSAGADIISSAAGRDAWSAVQNHLPKLRRTMLARLALRRPMSFLVRIVGQQFRRAGRWGNPQSGLHVVFLGPDGAGKSTVIDAVRARVADAFLHEKYQTFARGILPTRPKQSPHALPPRSLPASAIKAAWWAICYTAGYYVSVYPALARGGLMINHRYLLDALVDPKRYRYSGPARWIRGIWKVAPKPALMIFLDAPAEIIHQRKREVTLEEARRQRDAYRELGASQPNAVIVDTAQSLDRTIAQVTEIILSHMAARVARQSRGRS
jgi:thymidylate kinase